MDEMREDDSIAWELPHEASSMDNPLMLNTSTKQSDVDERVSVLDAPMCGELSEMTNFKRSKGSDDNSFFLNLDYL